MISLAGLNPEQRLAAETVHGPVLILAGAGSGKTRTITFRIAHMLENLGIPGSQILAVSFTNKAAQEMRERVAHLVHKDHRKGLTLSTFHSLGIKILKEDLHHLGYSPRFTIYDTSDQMSIIREALKNLRAEKAYDKSTIQSKISWLKNKGVSASEFKDSPFFDPENDYDQITEHVFHFYQDKLQFYNALDFDDILFLTVKLFKEFPQVAEKYSNRFRYLMIDEYQDTNGLQFEFIKGLTKTHQNICVVGDDDQSIYAFRGADITNILEFEKRYEKTTVIKLEENYRSYFPILHLANEVIKENKVRKPKTMRTSQVGGDKPMLLATGDTEHEAQVVIEEILKLQKQNISLSEMAILYRSNTQIEPFEDQLRLAQIPYQIIGGQKFYEKKEIKDLIAYLMLILNPRDELSLRRIINVPQRGIGNVGLAKLVAQASSVKKPLFNIVSESSTHPELMIFADLIKRLRHRFNEAPLSTVIQELISEIGYESYIEKSYDNPKLALLKKADLHHFLSSAQRFQDLFKHDATLENFIEKLLLADSQDPKNDAEPTKKHEVTLMTLHSSKGLEFDHVFLVGMEEEILPHKRTIQDNTDINEERRLCYVGLTRARKKLFMTYAKERKIYGKKIPRFPSRFIIELTESYISQDRTTFNDLTPEQAVEFKANFFSDLMNSLK